MRRKHQMPSKGKRKRGLGGGGEREQRRVKERLADQFQGHRGNVG